MICAPLIKHKRFIHDLSVFFNIIILIPTHESTACLNLTWFPPTSLRKSISWLPPQLHTPITYATTCSWVVVSGLNICEEEKYLFLAQCLHFVIFGITFLESRRLAWIMRTQLVFFICPPYPDLLRCIIKTFAWCFYIWVVNIFMKLHSCGSSVN